MVQKYVFGLIDVTSKFLVQYFIRTKVFYNKYIMYVKDKHRNVNMGVITNISDQGEYKSNGARSSVSSGGCELSPHVLIPPEQNAAIERIWRIISWAPLHC
jgi:hypothetical protein